MLSTQYSSSNLQDYPDFFSKLEPHKQKRIEESRKQALKNLEAQKKQQVQACLDFFFNNK